MTSPTGPVDQGSEVTFQCVANGGKPLPDIRWYMIGMSTLPSICFKVLGNSSMFSVIFTKEKTFCGFIFSSKDDNVLPKLDQLLNEKIFSPDANSFLQVFVPVEKGGEYKERVSSTECLLIHIIAVYHEYL